MADKQTIEIYLDIDYLQKKAGETSGSDYRQKFEANFDSVDPSIQGSLQEALEYARHLSALQKQAFVTLIAYAAFGASPHSLSPGLAPQEHVRKGANGLHSQVQEDQADSSPAREQFRLLTQEISKSIGNSQIAT